MQTRSETAADKNHQGNWVYPENEAAYWREQHSKQPTGKTILTSSSSTHIARHIVRS